jgi:hypothetical protein
MNPGNVDISKLIIGVRADNQTSLYSATFNSLAMNTEKEYAIPTATVASNIKDIATFPFWFDYFSIYINTASQIADATYNIYLKELALCYKNTILSVSNPNILSQLSLYPNPVSGDEITFKNQKSQNIRYQIFTLAGKMIQTVNLGLQQQGELKMPINKLVHGTYLIKLYQGEKIDTIRVIKR